jgi:signal transduction histidine kinase/DNA-binding response OmpR family regulator
VFVVERTTVLVAADADASARVRAALEAEHRVLSADTGPGALALLVDQGADCAVVATTVGGLAWLARARTVAPDLPAVLLGTSDDTPADVAAALHVTGHFSGPPEPDALRAAVTRALALRARAAEVERLERRAAGAEILAELASAMLEVTSQRDILALLLETLARLVRFDVGAAVLALDGPGDTTLQLHRRTPCGDGPLEEMWSRCLAELLARAGRTPPADTIVVEHGGLPASEAAAVIRAELHLPIDGGRVLGLVSLGGFTAGGFDADDERLAGLAARQAGAAVRRLSSRILDERRRMALMVESMADGVIMTDEKSEVFVINPSARRMLGVGRDVPVTATYLIDKLGFYPFDLVARAHAAREEVTVLGKTLHSIVSPVLDGAGRRVGVVVVLRDITVEKELEQRKEDFVAVVSHELRTPLTSIAGALDLVMAPTLGGLTDKQRTYLGMARESCTKLHVLVNDLLDTARLEHGKMAMVFEPLSLDQLALECVERFGPTADAKHIALSFQVERGARGVPIVGDADRLTQVVNNLLSNAIKFTPEHGRIEVEVFGPGAAASHVGVSVWNNGDPIPEEHHERVFDKFEQMSPSATRRVGGTGLGLAISRSIVEGHGGKIWVEHAPIGTKFVFTLPAAPAEVGTQKTVATEPPGAANEPEANGARQALIVADDRYAAYLLKGVLMAAGLKVHVAHDVDDGLGWARERRPELIIVDAGTAGTDGLALVEILKHDPDTRKGGVVVISARADREGALMAGADAFFAKPIEVEPFRATCTHLLAEKGRESQVKILVVDDDAGIRMICREVLERAGYVVREALDGKNALVEAKRFRPDLMLLDIMMPELDGYQTAKRFRADRDGALTPVIFVSARSQTADKVRAFKLGAEDYLVKPFDSMELLARVEKALARRERELGASPTTKLPGAGAIESEIERRLQEDGDFAFCYVDLDNLKAFNDYYGIAKADGVIRQTGDLMRQVVAREGSPRDFIGHIAGDDFVFITTPERVDHIGQTICRGFDRLVPLYYNKADRERGYIETSDRYGVLRKFPIMSVSVAALTTRRGQSRFRTFAELAGAAAEAKASAKAIPGSAFVRDGQVVHPAAAKSVA